MPGNISLESVQKFIETDYTVWNKSLKDLALRDQSLNVLARLTEDLGAIYVSIAARFGLQSEYSDVPVDPARALATVIIDAHFLSQILGIDIFAAVNKKMEEVHAKIRIRENVKTVG